MLFPPEPANAQLGKMVYGTQCGRLTQCPSLIGD